MNKTENIIRELKSLRGAKVLEFGREITLPTEVDELTIDTLDILEALKGYECDMVASVYNADIEDFEEEEVNNIDEFLDIMECVEKKTGNTYNWLANVTNHLDYIIYKSYANDRCYIELKVHRGYNDVRCNYTETVLYDFADIDEFYSALLESSSFVGDYKVNGKGYQFYTDIFTEGYEVIELETDKEIVLYPDDMEDLILLTEEFFQK